MRMQEVLSLRPAAPPLTPTEKERNIMMKQYAAPAASTVCLDGEDVLTLSTQIQADDSVVDKLDYKTIKF